MRQIYSTERVDVRMSGTQDHLASGPHIRGGRLVGIVRRNENGYGNVVGGAFVLDGDGPAENEKGACLRGIDGELLQLEFQTTKVSTTIDDVAHDARLTFWGVVFCLTLCRGKERSAERREKGMLWIKVAYKGDLRCRSGRRGRRWGRGAERRWAVAT